MKQATQLVESTTEALEYYIISDKLAIPKCGNAQEILTSYRDANKLYHLPLFLYAYPCVLRHTFKLLFPDMYILEAIVHYDKYDLTEWEAPLPEITTDATTF